MPPRRVQAHAGPPPAGGRPSAGSQGDAIGVLALNERGQLKTEKVPVGLVAGLVGGGLLGSLHHENLGLDKADRARLGSELEGGKAAVGVLVPLSDAGFMADKLASMGGTPETHQVSAEAVEEATKAATTAPPE